MNIKNMDIVREYGRPPFRAVACTEAPGLPDVPQACAEGLPNGEFPYLNTFRQQIPLLV